jgi:hypothetical protein
MTDDFPAMEDFNEGGQALRFNKGKAHWSLVDFKSLEPMVEVLEFGAKKYSLTNKLDMLSLLQLCLKSEFVTTVKILDQLSHEDFVAPVTEKLRKIMVPARDVRNIDLLIKNLCVEPVLSTSECTALVSILPESENTKQTTEKERALEKKKELDPLAEKIIQSMYSREKGQNSYEGFPTMELLKSFIFLNAKKVVKFAEVQKDYTLTMIIKHENTEVFCVVNATTPLVCLTTMLKLLQKQSLICKKITVSDGLYTESGKNNWKKGMPVSEVVESMLRHTFSLLSGESHDKESLIHHIGHIQCNAMFIAYILREKPEFNDLTDEGKVQ